MFDLLTLEAATSATGSRSNIGMIVLLVVMVAGMYFLMIRPQRQAAEKGSGNARKHTGRR